MGKGERGRVDAGNGCGGRDNGVSELCSFQTGPLASRGKDVI